MTGQTTVVFGQQRGSILGNAPRIDPAVPFEQINKSSNDLHYATTRQALQWYHRIRDVVRDFDDCEELRGCLKDVLGRHIVATVAQGIVAAAAPSRSGAAGVDGEDSDDFELGDLFRADYSNNESVVVTPAPTTTTKKANPLDEFLELLQPVETLVSQPFLEALGAANGAVPGILLRRALSGIPCVDPCPRERPLAPDEIQQPLTCLSNLVVLSTAAAKELRDLLEQEVDRLLLSSSSEEQDPPTGRDLEEASVLRNLLTLAALSVPNAGQETAQRPRSHFQRALRAVDDYPVVAFRRDGRQSQLDSVLSDAQRSMTLARDSGTTILKRVLLAGKDQESSSSRQSLLFRWLSLVAKTK